MFLTIPKQRVGENSKSLRKLEKTRIIQDPAHFTDKKRRKLSKTVNRTRIYKSANIIFLSVITPFF